MDLIEKLNKALKTKAKPAPSGSFRHENEVAILDAATKLLAKSELGANLLDFARTEGLTLHVLRSKQDFGYTPEEKAVYISCPAGVMMPTTRAVIHLAGALREAEQDTSDHLKRPTPKLGRERYARQLLEKKKDQAIAQAIVVYEIEEATGLSEIVDEFDRMGYRSLYEAYSLDVAESRTG